MKKRIFIFITIILALFFTNKVNASSIDYTLRVDNNRHFYETIIYNIEQNTTNSYLQKIINNDIYFDIENKYLYTKSIIKSGNSVIVILRHGYESNNIQKSRILNECFKSFSYKEDNYRITYYATAPFKCSSRADNITINVVTDLNALIETADIISDNKYTWNNINKDFMMDLFLGEWAPDSDVVAPIADDVVVPSDDMNEWPVPNIRSFSYVPFVITCVIILIGILIIIKIKKQRNTD